MLFLAVLCAFHYFLTDIWGSNLFPSRFFLLTFFSLLKTVTSSCLEVSLVFEDCHGWIRDYEDKTVAFSLCLGQGVRGHEEPSPPSPTFWAPSLPGRTGIFPWGTLACLPCQWAEWAWLWICQIVAVSVRLPLRTSGSVHVSQSREKVFCAR